MELERRIKRHWASDGSADHHNFQDLEEASKDPSNFMTVHPHRRAHLLYSLAPTAPLTSETFSRPAFPSPSGRCCWSIRDALLGYWVTPCLPRKLDHSLCKFHNICTAMSSCDGRLRLMVSRCDKMRRHPCLGRLRLSARGTLGMEGGRGEDEEVHRLCLYWPAC